MVGFPKNVVGKQRQNDRAYPALLYALCSGRFKVSQFDGLFKRLFRQSLILSTVAPVQQLCKLHGRLIRSINKFGFAEIEKSTYKQGMLFHYTSEEQMQLKGLNYIMVVTHGFLQKMIAVHHMRKTSDV